VNDGIIADAIGSDLNGSFGSMPGTDSDGSAKFAEISGDIDPTAPYAGESYDAAALIVLAMQAGGSADRMSVVSNIKKVANAPGEKILPGELAKGLSILATGGDIDYQGATDVELSTFGDAAGSFKELEVKGGKFEMIQIRN
jgi:hypothetical protein